MKLAILTSHPIQYYAPLFRELANQIEVHVFFAHQATASQQAAAGFGVAFDWDIDLTGGYSHEFLPNQARIPDTGSFNGCDTPTIGERLRTGGYEALLVTGWYLRSYWQGIIAARYQGIKTLVRGDSQLDTPRSAVKRVTKNIAYPLLLRSFDAAMYVGAKSRSYYEHYRYPRQRLFHSPHCIDTVRFGREATPEKRIAMRRRLGISDSDRVVLFAGKLLPFKRPVDVVDAVARLRRDGRSVQLMVAGAGTLEQELRAHASSNNVPLHMLGFRNQSEMPEVYAAADLLVLPSTGRETWGLVCNEALASGTPIVVSSAVGCAPDLAADNIAGRVFEVGNVAAMSEAISDILVVPPSRSAILRKSEDHSIAKAVEGILAAVSAASARQRVGGAPTGWGR